MADKPELAPPDGEESPSDEETVRGDHEAGHVADILPEESQSSDAETRDVENSSIAHRYRDIVQSQRGVDPGSEDGSADFLPRRAGSPIDSLLSAADESPSIQGSGISSPSSSVLPSLASRPGLSSPTPFFRPFDRRFQSRISSPGIQSPRPSSPAAWGEHSRSAYLGSQPPGSPPLLDTGVAETSSPPWEVVRWTRLQKLNGQALSEAGKRKFGSPTCLAVSASIVLGTSKGIILVFDYSQVLKMIIGPGTKAVECGPITAIAVSADHATIAGGHANGSIFTWDSARPSRPFLTIPPVDPSSQVHNAPVDGHHPNASVIHLGFLGTRHTALVSANDHGMAFSHLATRGTGALGRTVRTARLIGLYPNSKPTKPGRPPRPSTLLAFAPLPLGNVERPADSLGLTAMLTPYLLVIVSTTPVAETHHKSARPKEVAAHSAMTGCLAWFPAVKLKVPDPSTGSEMSRVKLAYCWSNVLTVLDVDELPTDDRDRTPPLQFRARSRWRCEEAIVAVQWLSRSVLTVLTITQRLIVLEDHSMRMTEAFDLIQKHIYHADLFSRQLHDLVERLDEDDTSMHGVVADAFYMSFKAYKGRLFLLGFNDVSIGALSNWADRLIALMEHGDYIAAIQLATSYYTGDSEKLTVGLPEATALRHAMVRDKLLEIMGASLRFAFGRRQKDKASVDDAHLRGLAESCVVACRSVGDADFLFEEVYEWYESGEAEGVFLETLEPYILDKSITAVPPGVVKAMVAHFVGKGLESRLEEMICHMDTATLDLDQITLLCKQHGLYDALIYVWNRALGDYITPLIDLLSLLVPLMQDGEYRGSEDVMENGAYGVDALKVFPYLSYVLTGRVYPTGEPIDDGAAPKAKAELYWFLFSGNNVSWPKGTSKVFLTRSGQCREPSFPYLRMLLKFDAPSFLSSLNEAFEDPFLNESSEKQRPDGAAAADLPEEQIFGFTVDRQYIVSILMEIMSPADFAPEDTVYLDMFIARNMPKYPQYLLFTGSTLTRVLTGLCRYPGGDLADDAQLSAEYLLSVYHPPDMSALIPLFREAGFYRILKRTYQADKQYGKLLQTYFEDPHDRTSIFDCIAACLQPRASPTRRQVLDVRQVLEQNARELIRLDAARAAKTLAAHAPDLHQHILDAAEDAPELQYTYLSAMLGAGDAPMDPNAKPDRGLVEQYVRLMCRFDPSHVSDYVGAVQSVDLRLDRLLPTLEETGAIDAAVVLMAREGQVREAMGRLTGHLEKLESALQGLLAGAESEPDAAAMQSGTEGLLEAMQKYVHVGIWLCQGQSRMAREAVASARRQQKSPADDHLAPDESLWLDLIDVSVQVTRRLSAALASRSEMSGDGEPKGAEAADPHQGDRLLALLRSLVQHTFTAVLTSTSPPATDRFGGGRAAPALGSNLSFLRILRAFLSRAAAASPSLADLRAVLSSVFSAYAYEESILQLTNRLLERSLFVDVSQSVGLRQRGWRPRGSTCEACGRRVWGPGVSGNVFGAWEARSRWRGRRLGERKDALPASSSDRRKANGARAAAAAADDDEDDDERFGGKGKGKGKGREVGLSQHDAGTRSGDDERNPDGAGQDSERRPGGEAASHGKDRPLGPLIVFACRHIYHQDCLEALQAGESQSPGQGSVGDQEYRCPIDG